MANISFTWLTVAAQAINNATMQPIFDAIRKIVDKAYRGGEILDADTVSGYGIGVISPLISGADLDNAVLGQLNRYVTTDAHRPPVDITGFPQYGTVYTVGYSATGATQIAIGIDTTNPVRMAVRSKNTTWGVWREVWNGSSDGNGGQPPHVKGTRSVTYSIPQNTFTTVATVSTVYHAVFEVWCIIADTTGVVNTYGAMGTILVSGYDNSVSLMEKHVGAGADLQVSGGNIQYKHNIAGNQTVFAWLRQVQYA
jgi:hypothetical protein